MNFLKIVIIILNLWNCIGQTRSNLLEQLSFIANQNRFTTQIFQLPFSLENVMAPSLDLALQACQKDFKWNRWNCPSSDFFMRRTSMPIHIDREDAYISAIITAAIIYSITKNCSGGTNSDCGCKDNSLHCSDDVAAALSLYEKTFIQNFPTDFNGAVRKHNHKVITSLLRTSLIEQCQCNKMNANKCIEKICKKSLKPFELIAQQIYEMYDEAIQVNKAANTRIIWANIPLDTLLFIQDSPNYCEPDAIMNWNGMRGRQCSKAFGEDVTMAEQESCSQLCRACGYRVRSQNAITEQACNCKFTWGFQLQCEKCVTVEKQYYCY